MFSVTGMVRIWMLSKSWAEASAGQFLHEEYLHQFERQAVDSQIGIQRRFSKPKRKEVAYAVSKDESLEKKTFVVVGLKQGRAADKIRLVHLFYLGVRHMEAFHFAHLYAWQGGLVLTVLCAWMGWVWWMAGGGFSGSSGWIDMPAAAA